MAPTTLRSPPTRRDHVAARSPCRTCGTRIAIENGRYYAPHTRRWRSEFTRVLREADCDMLSTSTTFRQRINTVTMRRLIRDAVRRIASCHVAGHYDEADYLKIDTLVATVKDAVWELLAFTYATHGLRPTLLERDFNFPPLPLLLAEVQRIRQLQAAIA